MTLKEPKALCPYIRMKHHMGFFVEGVTYVCGINGGMARGGQRSYLYKGHSRTPCTLAYTARCPHYQTKET